MRYLTEHLLILAVFVIVVYAIIVYFQTLSQSIGA